MELHGLDASNIPRESLTETLPKLFDSMIESAFEKTGRNRETDRFAVELSHQESRHEQPMGIKFRKYPQTDGRVIYNLMEKLVQSNETLSFDGLSVSIYIHSQHLHGGVRYGKYFDHELRKTQNE